MKKKTERKVKTANKDREQHWCAWDEPLWGPKKLNALLDKLYDGVKDGLYISLAQFREEEKISIGFWQELIEKNLFFKHGISVIKDAIYTQRLKGALEDPDNEHILLKGISNYDLDTIEHRHAEREWEIEKNKDFASFQNSLAKDLSTHNSNLKKDEVEEWRDLIHNGMCDSEGNMFFKFGGPATSEEECLKKLSPISTTSDQPGTNNE